LSAGDYWLGHTQDTSYIGVYYDSGAANQAARDTGVSYPTLNDPFGTPASYYAWDVSIYATYTVPVSPGGGGLEAILSVVGVI